MPTAESRGPLTFSIVAAVYNVARYLDAFIDSIDAQTFPATQFEVIAVDDGSTDASPARLREWAAARPDLVRIVTKTNGGQSTARNLGLEHARGAWVTFTDPDDVICPTYLADVAAFLAANPQTPMVATHRQMLDDQTGKLTDSHPLSYQFRGGNKLRQLDAHPRHFHGSAPAAFFRREVLEEHQLRFDPQVRPNFEDGHFCCRYLMLFERPAIGFLGSAVYQYRKRADASSTLQNSLGDADRFTSVLRHGYLDVLQRGIDRYGRAPDWLQNFVLYELTWYFTTQDMVAGAISAASGEVADEFHDLMRQIRRLLDLTLIEGFTVRWTYPSWRHIMAHAYADEPWHQSFAILDRYDRHQRLVRIRYFYTGDQPSEEIVSDGVPVIPAAAKNRSLRYHDRVLLRERIVWVPVRGASVSMRVDGALMNLQYHQPARPRLAASAQQLRAVVDSPAEGRPAPQKPARRSVRERAASAQDRSLLWLADHGPAHRLFKNAWVLMDRIHDADDSGEALFRYLCKNRKKINAWFVVQSGTADYDRLRKEGFRRVVAHGSLMWKLLMLNARHLISSHADVPVIAPPDLVELREPAWRFTFLQHGVIKDDLSNWLNPKRIDTFVVSTPAEYDSIAGDETDYVFTSKEVVLTGLPRFDRLRQIGRRFPAEDRDLILLTPTWRQWLLPPLARGSQRRQLKADFFDTEFARNWFDLLRSEELAALCAETGLRVGFLPHPNLQSVLDDLDLPAHVLPLRYEGHDVREYFARAAVLVTDYSSIAFNAAYIDRPVVYFQFDAQAVLGGAHVGKRGYFDYRRDGFGPVTSDLQATVAAITDQVRHGPAPTAPYAERIAATFPQRDGRCCKRVTDAIITGARRYQAPEFVGPSSDAVPPEQPAPILSRSDP